MSLGFIAYCLSMVLMSLKSNILQSHSCFTKVRRHSTRDNSTLVGIFCVAESNILQTTARHPGIHADFKQPLQGFHPFRAFLKAPGQQIAEAVMRHPLARLVLLY